MHTTVSTGNERYFNGLFYRTVGAGPLIIALHGFCASSFSWRYLIPRLQNSYSFCVFDLKGHGKSAKPRDGKYSLDDHASFIVDFITELDLKDVTLLGHSMGGGIALLTALRLSVEDRKRLRSLILIDSIGAPQRVPFFIKFLSLPLLARIALAVMPAGVLTGAVLHKAYFDRSKVTKELVATYAKNLDNADGLYAITTTARELLTANAAQVFYQYHLIDVPTLLLWGSEDNFVSPGVGIALNTQLEKSRLVFLDRCGHVPQEELPEIVSSEISRFMSEPS